MDYQRKVSKTRKIVRRVLFVVVPLLLIVFVTMALSQLEPAAPSVQRSTLWDDAVKRGDMVRQVRGPGTLVPVDIRWINPSTDGRVEKVLVHPGTFVDEETILLEMSNTVLEVDAQDAKLQVKAIESQYASRKIELENQLLSLRQSAANVEANYQEAKLKAQSEAELLKNGLIPELQVEVTKVRAEELEKLKKIEEERISVHEEYAQRQLDALKAQVDQTEALYQLKERQVEMLKIRALTSGVLEQMLVEVGQQVSPQTSLAKVTDPTRLKAVLRIEQNQAREVLIGMSAVIDIRSTVLRGRVSRIDPSVREGTVNVDVELLDELPAGARPDQSVDGTVEIEQLNNILYVGRPVFGQPNSTITLFKFSPDGNSAERVRVQLGRSSVNWIEVIDGLDVGDRVILLDMSEWDAYDKIRLR